MSIAVLTKAMRVALPPAQKLVLLTLADCCTETGEAWPKLSRLADATGYPLADVRQALREMEDRRLVTITKRPSARPTNLYRINLALLDEMAAARRAA